jgi:hypothetical protein
LLFVQADLKTGSSRSQPPAYLEMTGTRHTQILVEMRFLANFVPQLVSNDRFLISTSQVLGLQVWDTAPNCCLFLFLFFKTDSCYVAQAGLKLKIVLPPPPDTL